MRFPLFSALLAALVLTGCRSAVEYENRAVERAREYLLENAPELSTTQRAFVRYNRPVLLVEGIFGGSTAARSDISQICITWLIPGKPDAYLVFGASDIRLQSWYPNRLIRKQFSNTSRPFLQGVASARKYALNALYGELSAPEYNHVRFTLPKVYRTDFALPKNLPAGKERSQCSFVWSPCEGKDFTVIFGLASPDLADFTPAGGKTMTPEDWKPHALQELPRPKVLFPEPEKKQEK